MYQKKRHRNRRVLTCNLHCNKYIFFTITYITCMYACTHVCMICIIYTYIYLYIIHVCMYYVYNTCSTTCIIYYIYIYIHVCAHMQHIMYHGMHTHCVMYSIRDLVTFEELNHDILVQTTSLQTIDRITRVKSRLPRKQVQKMRDLFCAYLRGMFDFTRVIRSIVCREVDLC